MHAKEHVWKSVSQRTTLRTQLAASTMGFRDPTQAVRVVQQTFYPLSHVAHSSSVFFLELSELPVVNCMYFFISQSEFP